MSEVQPHHEKGPEIENNNEVEVQHESTRSETRSEASGEVDKVKVERLKKSIEKLQTDQPTESKKPTEQETGDLHILPPDKTLKKQSRRNYLSSIRSSLGAHDRILSRFIHQDAVNNISEVSAKTVLRPSGILVGGIVTLIGSVYYLYATKHTGYKYNFFTAIFLFVGGFIVGLVLEFIYNLLIKKHSKDTN